MFKKRKENTAMYHCMETSYDFRYNTLVHTMYATLIEAQSTQLIASITVSKLFRITIGND